MIANIALDYTEWAPPIYEDAIKMDIDSYRIMHGRTPSKIIMWVHQWEYLSKRYKDRYPAYIITEAQASFHGLKVYGIEAKARPAESSDGGQIWGVCVEVRDPDAHKP